MSSLGTIPESDVNEALYENSFSRITVPKARVFGAAIHEAFLDNPTPSAARTMELGGDPFAGGRSGIVTPQLSGKHPEPDPKIPQQEFNKNYAQLGLQWNPEMTYREAVILADRKKRERRNIEIMSRGKGGAVETVGKFGSALIASLLDPGNIAVSFIPVAGEARWAAFAAKFGPTKTRLARGAAEGLVGQAIVEPLAYSARSQEQADYTAMDSLNNILVGVALGSGLHYTVGKIKDVHTRKKLGAAADNRATDAAMRQMMDDKQVDVSALHLANEAELIPTRRDVSDRGRRLRTMSETSTSLDLDEITAGNRPRHTVVSTTGKGRRKFKVLFPDETGSFKGIPGYGRTEAEAVDDLLKNYVGLRDSLLARTEMETSTGRLKEELEDLTNKRNQLLQERTDPKAYERKLRERGAPVDLFDTYRKKLAERAEERKALKSRLKKKMTQKKVATKLRTFDAETAKIAKEFDAIKDLNFSRAYADISAEYQQGVSRLNSEIKRVQQRLFNEAEELSKATVRGYADPAKSYLYDESYKDRVQPTSTRDATADSAADIEADMKLAQEELSNYPELSEADKAYLSEADEMIKDAAKKGKLLSSAVSCVAGGL